MPRHALVNLMLKHSDLLRLVVTMLSAYAVDGAIHRPLIAFWTTTIIAYLERRDEVEASEMSVFLPSIVNGIKMKANSEVQVRLLNSRFQCPA